jgi:hypothetical protein
MAGGANIYWNSDKKRWEITSRSGDILAYFSASEFKSVVAQNATTVTATTLNATNLAVGGATALTYLARVRGTIPLSNIGTAATVVVTFVPGSLGVTGDTPVIIVRSSLAADVSVGAAYVPSTSTINIQLTNSNVNSVASQPAVGTDVILVRS